jgi:hypothetical protein
MNPVIDTKDRTSNLDNDLETARRQFSALEREEAEARERERAACQRWIEQKAAKFRRPLELFLSVFPMIEELNEQWRERVFRGQEPFDPEMEKPIRNLFAIWLGYCPMFLERAEYLNRNGADFEAELNKLMKFKREADKVLRAWEAPELSAAFGLRDIKLTKEQTRELRELMGATIWRNY